MDRLSTTPFLFNCFGTVAASDLGIAVGILSVTIAYVQHFTVIEPAAFVWINSNDIQATSRRLLLVFEVKTLRAALDD
jgi:hypothetical protein